MTALGNGNGNGNGDGPAPDISLGYGTLGGMVVSPAGAITYNFAGHVAADGLDFLHSVPWTDGTKPVPAPQRITWREQNTGAMLADAYANDIAGRGALTLESLGGNFQPGPPALYDYQSSLTLQSGADDGSSMISLDIETPTRGVAKVLLDATGASDYTFTEWQDATDLTSRALNGAFPTASVPVPSFTVNVPSYLAAVEIVCAFVCNSRDINSNVRVAIYMDGAPFQIPGLTANYRDWLIGGSSGVGMTSAWYGTINYPGTATVAGINTAGGSAPVMFVPLVMWPGSAGLHTFTMVCGGTGNGGTISNRYFKGRVA